MNYNQYLLIKLAEEASEVAQAAIKCSLFGYDGVDPREVNGKTNFEKLMYEILDLQAVAELIEELPITPEQEEQLGDFNPREYIASKRVKLKYYFDISQELEQKGKI
jgi:hypothetical protein